MTGFLYFGLDDVGVASVNSGGSARPAINSVTLSNANIVLNSADGLSNRTYYVLTGTNLTEPLSQWTRVATNIPTTTGNYSITLTNAMSPNAAQRFYVLQVP